MRGVRSSLRVVALVATAACASIPALATGEGASFTPGAPMHHARAFQTATELQNGNILVAGGYDGSVFLPGGSGPSVFPDSEIYNWHTGTWKVVAQMNVARAAAVAVRLPEGRVLVVGGFDAGFNGIDSAETYDPRQNTWTLTGPLHGPRAEDFVTALLPGGRVLIAGGYLRGFPFIPLSSAELWDPHTNQWSVAASMHVARGELAWSELKDGRVLVTGGIAIPTFDSPPPVASAELYDPAEGTWSLTGGMNVQRDDHSAVLLENGKVLVAGGEVGGTVRTSTAELYDPHSGSWTLTGSMTAPRNEADGGTVRLPDGDVLITGGFAAEETPQSSADVYNVDSGSWSAAGTMSSARAGHTAVVLNGGRGVLVMGGLFAPPSSTASVDIFR